MYNKIYDFCKVRNLGNIYKNDPLLATPRVQFLLELLKEEGIEYELDKFPIQSLYREPLDNQDDEIIRKPYERRKRWEENARKRGFFLPERKPIERKELFGFNIILKGTSNRMVVAHHDINNHLTDNANDNSASVINCIMIKKLIPEMNVILLDGEEFGGYGSKRASKLINEGKFGHIEWVLNLELTGKGGNYFFIGDYPGALTNHIKSIFDCPIVHTPYNDSVTFRANGIDSVVINPLPPLPDGVRSQVKWDENTYLDFKLLYNCHSPKDNIASIDVNDMKDFVENVILKILK